MRSKNYPLPSSSPYTGEGTKAEDIRKMKSRWLVLAILVFARTGIGFQFVSVAALMPQLKGAFGINYTQIGLLLGIFMLTSVFLALPSGMIAARLGDRPVLWLGLASLVAGSILVSLSDAYTPALAGRLMGGVGAVFTTITAAKVLTDWFTGREIATAMSLLGVTWPAGIALGMTLLPLIEVWQGWRAAVFITGAIPALALLLTVMYPLGSPVEGNPTRSEKQIPALWSISGREFWIILAGGAAWPLMSAGGYVVFTSYAPGLLISRGASVVTAGLVIGLLSWSYPCAVNCWVPWGMMKTDAGLTVMVVRVGVWVVADTLLDWADSFPAASVAVMVYVYAVPALNPVLVYVVGTAKTVVCNDPLRYIL